MQRLWLQILKIAGIYLAIQQGFALYWLLKHSNRVPQRVASYRMKATAGKQQCNITEHDTYVIEHSLINGMERIVYKPHNPQFDTPILMQHGMWHGAWCWSYWQQLLAEWGWETHAYSLPGHAGSQAQRPLWLCTLDYYLAFLKAEVDRMPRPPILMGHSMGGAIIQWYLKYIDQDVPAVVLVAPWVSHSSMLEGTALILKHDPLAMLLTVLQWNANSWVRSPKWAAQKLISDGAMLSPEALHKQLTGESVLAVMQHNPPFWTPAKAIKPPMLVLAGEIDQVVSVNGLRATAEHYKATFQLITDAAHNLMHEHNYEDTAEHVHRWLVEQQIP
jgi:pimeloyl-ACP methyl ester carboxylesterase